MGFHGIAVGMVAECLIAKGAKCGGIAAMPSHEYLGLRICSCLYYVLASKPLHEPKHLRAVVFAGFWGSILANVFVEVRPVGMPSSSESLVP